MDEFGVLTQSFGLKPQGKSAPMGSLKGSRNSNSNSQIPQNPQFQTPYETHESSFDYDSIFGVPNELKSSNLKNGLFDSMVSPSISGLDDLLPGFDQLGIGSNLKSWGNLDSDDLIPGFGQANVMDGDGKTSPDAVKNPSSSPIDGLEFFSTVYVKNSVNENIDILSGEHIDNNDIESFFGMNAHRPVSTTSDSVFDSLFQNSQVPEVAQSNSIAPQSNTKMDISSINMMDDMSFMLGVDASIEEFQENEGESKERRAAKWKRHQETKERMAKALSDMNQRNFKTQQEQDEKHRIGETENAKIKKWASGKEGNLRALLSTLQSVLWPECGWQPVSLTDLIASTSVKKIYMKATLCVHPDKVQQKGSDTRQKFIAEKVFDLLKEAWNKFNAEELP